MSPTSPNHAIIKYTPDGGNYYRAYALMWLSIIIMFVPIATCLLVVSLNPFWFRDPLFNWFKRTVRKFTNYRNDVMYRIYLGCDPALWHALKDNHK